VELMGLQLLDSITRRTLAKANRTNSVVLVDSGTFARTPFFLTPCISLNRPEAKARI